jgi:(p)ppGpp synthase/HD superfamily hydrolase
MFSPHVELAITTMLEAHGLGRRKAGRGFEATHVLSVAMIVGDFGFSEHAIVAAILHDTLEDTSLDRDVIRRQFGERVLEIVIDVTEPPKSVPWRTRKETYIEHLRHSQLDEARAVASADKIHNLSNMIVGLEQQGAVFADAFTADIDEMVWYHQQVHDMLVDTWAHPMLDEHGRRLERFLDAARIASAPEQ